MAKKAARKKPAKRRIQHHDPAKMTAAEMDATEVQALGNDSPLIVRNGKGDVSKAGTIKKFLADNPDTQGPKEVSEALSKLTGLAISANDVSMAKTALKGNKGKKAKAKVKNAPAKATRAPQQAPATNGHMSPAQLAKALVKAVGTHEALVYIKVVGELQQ